MQGVLTLFIAIGFPIIANPVQSPSEVEAVTRVISAETLSAEDLESEQLGEFSLKKYLVLRIRFHVYRDDPGELKPYSIKSVRKLAITIQDSFPETERSLFPEELVQVSESKFLVAFIRDKTFFADQENLVYLVISDFNEIEAVYRQVLIYRTLDLLQ